MEYDFLHINFALTIRISSIKHITNMKVTINYKILGEVLRTTEKELTPQILKRWAKMTDENFHPEVRAEIAEFFIDCYGNEERAKYFKEDYGLVIGCDITHAMLQEIKESCGEEVYEKVRECL